MRDDHADLGGLRVLDPARLHTLGEETGLGVRGVASLFAEQMGHQLDELRAAVGEGSPETVSQIAHKCAGSSMLAGMERLSRLLRALEHAPADWLKDADGCVAGLEVEFGAVNSELSALLATPGDTAAPVNP